MKFRCYLNKDEIKKEYEQLSLYKSPVFKFKYYEIVNLLSLVPFPSRSKGEDINVPSVYFKSAPGSVPSAIRT